MSNKAMTEDVAKDIKGSGYWEHVCNELDFRIGAAIAKLKMCAPEDLERLQHRIQMLEELKGLPDEVIEREEVVKY
jgi:hypothetical protein